MNLPDSVAAEAEAVGFVLAGGRSSRMGADKALAELGGRPMVLHALEVLREAGLPAAIAGARSDLAGIAPVVEDAAFGLGPLGGVCAGLAATDAELAVFLPVDMPLLPASLVAYLVRHAQITGAAVTVASFNGFAQTFPAVVERAALPALEAVLHSRGGGCFSAFRAAAAELGRPFSILPVELLAQPGHVSHRDSLPAALWFLNVNSAAEIERARGLVSSFHRVS